MRESLINVMKDWGIQGMILENPANYFWYTGFSGEECFCVLTQDDVELIVDSRFTEQAKEQAPTVIVRQYNSPNERDDMIANFFQRHDTTLVGYEGTYLTHKRFTTYEQILGKRIEFIDATRLLDIVRAVKDKDEITCIEKAANIVDNVFDELCKVIRVGMTESEVAAEIEYRMRKHGAQKASFDTIAASGYRAALPHAMPSEKKLQVGETIVLDFGAYYNGYCSDITRTVFIGEPDKKMKKVYEVVLKAQLSAISAITDGIWEKAADAIARDIIAESGYGEYFGHSLGHGIGVEIHESPRLSPRSVSSLVVNNVVTVEPGIYLPGKGGVRIEDDVVVLDKGCRILTKASKDIIIVE